MPTPTRKAHSGSGSDRNRGPIRPRVSGCLPSRATVQLDCPHCLRDVEAISNARTDGYRREAAASESAHRARPSPGDSGRLSLLVSVAIVGCATRVEVEWQR